MLVVIIFQALVIIHGFNMTFCDPAVSFKQHSNKNQNHEISREIKVLAAVQSPFTYFNSSHGFFDGIDVRILDTIAKRLHLKLTFTQAKNFTSMTARSMR